MALATRALLAVGASIAVVVVGTAGFIALGGQPPGVRDCPGGLVGADIGGPFELVAHTGETMTDRDLAGKPSLLYFGFSTCPDVCPTDLADISAAVDILAEEKGMDVNAAFITVDPKRDTPEMLSEYVPFFSDTLLGLTGPQENVDAVAKAYRVYYAERPDPDFPGGYSMDHSAYIYLLDRDAEFVTYFKHDDAPDYIAEGVACHMES